MLIPGCCYCSLRCSHRRSPASTPSHSQRPQRRRAKAHISDRTLTKPTFVCEAPSPKTNGEKERRTQTIRKTKKRTDANARPSSRLCCYSESCEQAPSQQYQCPSRLSLFSRAHFLPLLLSCPVPTSSFPHTASCACAQTALRTQSTHSLHDSNSRAFFLSSLLLPLSVCFPLGVGWLCHSHHVVLTVSSFLPSLFSFPSFCSWCFPTWLPPTLPVSLSSFTDLRCQRR